MKRISQDHKTETTAIATTISTRHNGPPGIGNGGIVCGLLADHFGGACEGGNAAEAGGARSRPSSPSRSSCSDPHRSAVPCSSSRPAPARSGCTTEKPRSRSRDPGRSRSRCPRPPAGVKPIMHIGRVSRRSTPFPTASYAGRGDPTATASGSSAGRSRVAPGSSPQLGARTPTSPTPRASMSMHASCGLRSTAPAASPPSRAAATRSCSLAFAAACTRGPGSANAACSWDGRSSTTAASTAPARRSSATTGACSGPRNRCGSSRGENEAPPDAGGAGRHGPLRHGEAARINAGRRPPSSRLRRSAARIRARRTRGPTRRTGR